MASVGYALPFGSFGYDTGSVFASSIGMTAAPPHFACLPLGAMPPFVFGAALPHQPQSKQQRRQQQDLVGQRAAPSRPARGRGRRAARVPITLQDVIQAVESLYADQLMPYGRLLRKRIVEQAAERSGGGSKEVEDRELRTLCTSCPRLQVEDVEAAEWTATLAGQPQDFVDVHSPEDLYPSQMWADAAKYLSALEGEEMVLPGGRYMCARTLVARGLAFLSGYSLGQVAHIVQLAISHKKLLGYSEGTLVPYARSQSMLKEKHAEIQRACPGAACRKGSVAGWEVLHECLRQILEEAIVVGQRAVPLSNLKRLFQERFGIELSETALGYAKLSELLQDARVQDLCEVQLASAGYVLLPLRKRVERSRISLVDGLGFAECGGACASVAMQQTPWSTDTRPRAISAQPAVAPTTTGRCRPKPLCLEEHASTPTTPTCSDTALSTSASDAASSTPEPLACLSATAAQAPFPPTPSPYAMAGSMLMPRLFSALPPMLDEAESRVPSQAQEPMRVPLQLAQFSHDPAIITMDERGAVEGWRTSGIRQLRETLPLTPSGLDSLGFSVHNTFIHQPLPPPTPMKIASRLRASSLPRAAC